MKIMFRIRQLSIDAGTDQRYSVCQHLFVKSKVWGSTDEWLTTYKNNGYSYQAEKYHTTFHLEFLV